MERDEKMNGDRYQAGRSGCEDWKNSVDSQEDAIARNPHDIECPGKENQRIETGRHSKVAGRKVSLAGVLDADQAARDGLTGKASALVVNAARGLEQAWMGNQRTEMARPPIGLGAILRHKWTIVLLTVLVSAPLIAAIWTQIVPQYNARAEIRVRPVIPVLVFPTEENGRIPLYDSFVNTQISVIRSATVLGRALEQREVQSTQWYEAPPQSLLQRLQGSASPPMGRLRGNLTAEPRRRTEIIDVSLTSPVRKDAEIILNAVLDQYIEYVREQSTTAEGQMYGQLVNEYRSLDKEIQGREKICAELCKKLGTTLPQDLIANKRVRLDELQARLSQVQQDIAVLEWEIAQAGTDDGNDVEGVLAGAVDTQPPYHEDMEWRNLDLKVRTLEHQVANPLYGPNHPERVRLAKELGFAKELRQVRETQLDDQWDERATGSVTALGTAPATSIFGYGGTDLAPEYRLARLERQKLLMQDDLDKQRVEFTALFDTAQLLQTESDVLKHKRELFRAVRQRLDQKNMERNVPGSIEILTRARSSSDPVGDRRMVFTAMALVAGLGVGGGAAFLRASRNQAIYAPNDMPKLMQIPFLGYVPLVRAKKAPGKALWEEIAQDRVLLIESVRLVRTALLSRLTMSGTTTILITSAAAGTGKSSFTRILAQSMAQAGKNVLVIDADFHKMTFSRSFDLLDKPGFMDSLRRRVIDSQYIYATRNTWPEYHASWSARG